MARPNTAGDSVELLDNVRKLHNDVRDVAKLMCEELGLDPDVTVPCHENDRRRFTPYEEVFYLIPPTLLDGGETISVARWELYRREAAVALAGWRAVHKHALMS